MRIGFVSPDLGRHPVGYFVAKLLENIPKDQFEVVCYSEHITDEMTERLKAASDEWLDITGISDTALATRIRDDRIDILFDLAGHTAKNRLLVFARKPAPVQISWIGYAGTTGLASMDYLLSDNYHTPEGCDPYYSEKIIRLPDDHICYEPPSYAPPVKNLPLINNGYVTFGCFNNPAKLNSDVLQTWSKILKQLPDSRLILKYKNMDTASNQERISSNMLKEGLDPSRLIYEGWQPHKDMLERYNDIDMALDPYPFTGGLTTCEALWMGVPVITTPRETFASRQSASYLHNIGLDELIATDVLQYVEMAVNLARDVDRLSSLRSGLRDRMANSALCDGPNFGKNFSAAMRKIWQQHSQSTKSH